MLASRGIFVGTVASHAAYASSSTSSPTAAHFDELAVYHPSVLIGGPFGLFSLIMSLYRRNCLFTSVFNSSFGALPVFRSATNQPTILPDESTSAISKSSLPINLPLPVFNSPSTAMAIDWIFRHSAPVIFSWSRPFIPTWSSNILMAPF